MKKLLSKQKVGRVGKAQIKLTMILCYYIFSSVMGLAVYTFYYEMTDAPSTVISSLGTAVIALICFVPVVIILFSIDLKTCMNKIKKAKKKP